VSAQWPRVQCRRVCEVSCASRVPVSQGQRALAPSRTHATTPRRQAKAQATNTGLQVHREIRDIDAHGHRERSAKKGSKDAEVREVIAKVVMEPASTWVRRLEEQSPEIRVVVVTSSWPSYYCQTLNSRASVCHPFRGSKSKQIPVTKKRSRTVGGRLFVTRNGARKRTPERGPPRTTKRNDHVPVETILVTRAGGGPHGCAAEALLARSRYQGHDPGVACETRPGLQSDAESTMRKSPHTCTRTGRGRSASTPAAGTTRT
jgi:hypothetical protein